MAQRAEKHRPDKKPLPASPWRFVRECAFTVDEHWRAKGLASEVQPFPCKRYLKLVVGVWRREKCLRIEKSRQLMVTWLLAALWLWFVLTNRGVRVAWICKKKEAAEAHLKQRLFKIYELIPKTFDVPRVELRNGVLTVYHDRNSDTPTAFIEPMASETSAGKDEHGGSAAKQLRSFTYTGVVWDESAFDRNQSDIHGAALPVIDSGGWFNACSSANGKNFFYRWGHSSLDDPTATEAKLERRPLMRGVEEWTHNAFHHLRVHHTADPDKDPATGKGAAWYNVVKARYVGRQWKREFEIDFNLPAGVPVYCDVAPTIFVPQSFTPGLTVARGYDWGWNGTACVWAQLEDRGQDRYCLHFLTEMVRAQNQSLTIAQFGEDVLARSAMLFPSAQCFDFGDISGEQHSGQTGQTVFDMLKPLGIRVRAQKFFLPPSIGLFQWLLSKGWVEVDPVGCPRLKAALEGGYSRDEYGEPVKDGMYDHIADAARYLANNLFVMAKGPGGADTVKPADPWRGYFRVGGHTTAVRGTVGAREDRQHVGRTPITSRNS